MLTDLDSPASPALSETEDAVASPEAGLVDEDGVEVIEVGAGEDTWETESDVVGLSNKDQEVVAAAKL